MVALREITESPIAMVSIGGETAVIESPIGGADVYLERPVRIGDLAARARSLSRQYGRELGLRGNL